MSEERERMWLVILLSPLFLAIFIALFGGCGGRGGPGCNQATAGPPAPSARAAGCEDVKR